MLIQIYDFVVLIENIKEKNLDFEVCLLSQFNGRIILVIDLVTGEFQMFVKFWHYKIHKKFACVYMQYTTNSQPF